MASRGGNKEGSQGIVLSGVMSLIVARHTVHLCALQRIRVIGGQIFVFVRVVRGYSTSNVKLFPVAETVTLSPSWISPARIFWARGFSSFCWMMRFIGRAPKDGSQPSSARRRSGIPARHKAPPTKSISSLHVCGEVR